MDNKGDYAMQFTTEPNEDGSIWWEFEQLVEVEDLEPGMKYYARTVTYGPWESHTVPKGKA